MSEKRKLSPFLRDYHNVKTSKSVEKVEKLVRVTTAESRKVKASLAIKQLEERLSDKIKLKKLKLFYENEETIFSIVNLFASDIIGPGFSFIPDPDSKDKNLAMSEAILVNKWANSKYIKLKNRMLITFRDILIYGRGFIELCYNIFKDDIPLIHTIDPEDMDFLRDSRTREPILDQYLQPKGYVFKEFYSSNQIKLNADEIAHFKIWGLGEPCLGLSPLVPLYSVLKQKMNIEEAAAEGIYRRIFPWIMAYVGDADHEPTIEEIDKVHEAISEIEKKTEFTFPYYFKVETKSPEGVSELKDYHSVYEDLIYETFHIPRGLIRGGRRTEVERGNLRWERTVLNYQSIIGEQIKDHILDRYYDVKRFQTSPRLKWNVIAPQHKMQRQRAISSYFRHGTLTWDLDTENYIRKEMKLPIKEGATGAEVNEQIIKRISNVILDEMEKRYPGSDAKDEESEDHEKED